MGNRPSAENNLVSDAAAEIGTPLYVGALPGISAGKDLNSPEVAKRGLLADAARARGSAIRATDGMLRRLPARRGLSAIKITCIMKVMRLVPPPSQARQVRKAQSRLRTWPAAI